MRSLRQRLSINIRFPDLGIENMKAERMSFFEVILIPEYSSFFLHSFGLLTFHSQAGKADIGAQFLPERVDERCNRIDPKTFPPRSSRPPPAPIHCCYSFYRLPAILSTFPVSLATSPIDGSGRSDIPRIQISSLAPSKPRLLHTPPQPLFITSKYKGSCHTYTYTCYVYLPLPLPLICIYTYAYNQGLPT